MSASEARRSPRSSPAPSNTTQSPAGPQGASGKPVRLLALDLATKTGWAVTELGTGRVIKSGVKNLIPKSPLPLKFAQLATLIKAIVEQHHIQAVITEAPNPFMVRSMENARLALGLNTHAEFTTHTLELDFLQPLSTSTLKKHAATLVGDAKATKGKQQAMRAATSLLGRAPVDDNEADAVVLGNWAALNAAVKEDA